MVSISSQLQDHYKLLVSLQGNMAHLISQGVRHAGGQGDTACAPDKQRKRRRAFGGAPQTRVPTHSGDFASFVASNKPDTSMLDGTPLKEALELAKMPGAQNKFPTGRPDFRDAMRYVHKCWVDNFILLDGKKGPPLYELEREFRVNGKQWRTARISTIVSSMKYITYAILRRIKDGDSVQVAIEGLQEWASGIKSIKTFFQFAEHLRANSKGETVDKFEIEEFGWPPVRKVQKKNKDVQPNATSRVGDDASEQRPS